MHGPIVVTVDGSPDNERVIPFAADLVRLGEVELQLVQVHTLTAALRRAHADVCGGLLAYEEARVRLELLAGRAGVAKVNPWPVRSADWLGEIELAVAEAR